MNTSAKRKRHLRNHVLTGRAVMTGLWADALLVMASSAYNGGEAFVALHQPQGQGVALGVAVDVALAVALIGDRALHLEDRSSNWGRAIRVITAGMSLALNCAVPIWQGHPGVAAFHAFLPVLLVLLAEYAQDVTLQFGEIAEEYEAETQPPVTATSVPPVAAVAQPVFRPGGVRPPGVPAPSSPQFSAVPNMSTVRPASQPVTVPADRPADRPVGPPAGTSMDRSTDRSDSPRRTGPQTGPKTGRADRSDDNPQTGPQTGPARKSKPRTDAQITKAIREEIAAKGSAPTTYQLKQRFGIGHDRAARLLAELDTTPAGPPGHNGAAHRSR